MRANEPSIYSVLKCKFTDFLKHDFERKLHGHYTIYAYALTTKNIYIYIYISCFEISSNTIYIINGKMIYSFERCNISFCTHRIELPVHIKDRIYLKVTVNLSRMSLVRGVCFSVV